MTTPRTNTQVPSHAASLEALLQQAQGAGRNSNPGDAAAFQRWMQQYRQPEANPTTPLSAPLTMPTSRVPQATVAARTQTARDADPQAFNTRDADAARQAPAPAQANEPVNGAASRPPAKELRKAPSTSRAQDQGKAAKADGAAKPRADAATEGTDKTGEATEAGDPVRFQTAQGEATAWVKELPVPDDVAASDPAAMLAWLASLQTPAQQGAQVLTDPDAGAPAAGLQPTPGDPSGGLPRGPSGAEALTLQALQRGQTDGGLGQGQGRDEGAETQGEGGTVSLRALGLDDASSATGDASAATFASALQRELQPLGAPRGEAVARHYTGTLHTPMESPAFTQALSDRVAFWVNGPAAEGPMTAELRLNPAEMGPVHIRIELDGQNAHIDFAAAAAETREAIEASLGHLSAALEESGLKLSGGGVSDQTPQQQAWAQAAAGQQGSGQGASARQGRDAEGRWVSTGVAEGVSESLGARPGGQSRPGGLDLYA